MLDKLFMHVLDMSRTACIVILVVILARLLLKRAPKIVSYSLWAVVLFRLLCPISFKADVSIVPEITPIAQNYSFTYYDGPLSLTDVYRATSDALNDGTGLEYIELPETIDENGLIRSATFGWREVCILFGQYVWLFGVAVMLVYGGISYLIIRRKLKVVVPVRYDVFIADDIQSPFVIGLINPTIYLPCGLGEKEQEYIILHEDHHVERHDHVYKALGFLALCIHWFNPLVWLAFVLASKDMEMSCDEAVIRKKGAGIRAEYSVSLLSLATGRRVIAGTPLAFGEGNAKDRIKNLGKWKQHAVWVVTVAVTASLLLTVGLATNPFGRLDRMEIFVGAVTEIHTDESGNITALVIDSVEKGVGTVGILLTEETSVFSHGAGDWTLEDLRATFQGDSPLKWGIDASCYRGKKKLTTDDGSRITAYEAYNIGIISDRMQYFTELRDGTQISVVGDGYSRGYYTTNTIETKLLEVILPDEPRTQYADEENILDSMSATAQWEVKAFYTRRSLLYDEQEVLERVYALYLEVGKDFPCGRLEQSIVITAASDRVIYISTTVTEPVGISEDGYIIQSETSLCDAFDRETGEHIDTWDLFSVPKETVIKAILDENGITDEPRRSRLESADWDSRIVFYTDSLSVWFKPSDLPGETYAVSLGLSYIPAIQELMYDWAVPKARE